MKQNKQKFSFPKRFMWGASISTHQVEGGNNNQWSQWELETAQVKVAQAKYHYKHLEIWPEIEKEATMPSTYVSGRACEHFTRYEHDFDIAKALNFNTLRCGIEWSRLEPTEGEFDKAALAHYKRYFEALKKRGIKPVITLWHWSEPIWFAEKGGFLRRRNIKYFKRYVRYVAEQLGLYFDHVIVLNEPTVYAGYSYGRDSKWPPEANSYLQMFQVLLNLASAYRGSARIIKKIRPKAKLGCAHNCAYMYAGDDAWLSRAAAYLAHKFGNEWFINRVRRYEDFLGLNYYFANEFHGTRVHNPNKHLNDLGWDMQPDKICPLIVKLHARYKKPVMITESGVADRHDKYRKWWIAQSIKALDCAIKEGAEVEGYIHWSLLDNFEWAEGFWPRFGLVEIDYQTMQRKPRASARWYGQVIKKFQKN